MITLPLKNECLASVFPGTPCLNGKQEKGKRLKKITFGIHYHHDDQGVNGMRLKTLFSGMAVSASLAMLLCSGCASSPSTIQQPEPTSYMKSAVGTPDELSPLAPAEGKNVRRVGGHWVCDVNGRTMVYNSASSSWEPQKK
jgi:hypothetical protein